MRHRPALEGGPARREAKVRRDRAKILSWREGQAARDSENRSAEDPLVQEVTEIRELLDGIVADLRCFKERLREWRF